ncbi:cation:proton antiporter domain-containing protein [Streptomyces zagrosensis]|uniref:Kef-type K+ transport system membrane component KefB n=1 Tax=Streptomyces zagrosensis TaxID=1042984 RepID=A0A7W9UY22_9ACTN|nr:cation:proton antiporter [Streptomyces zagrosensis]MBB5935460.1 Kef-type K+ transport system membrane component KefB [Streptomyces zagrosensis]
MSLVEARGTPDTSEGEDRPRGRRQRLLGYAALVALPAIICVVALIAAPEGSGAAGAGHGVDHTTAKLLLAASGVLAVALGAGALAVRIGQPRVMGEICAGLALGPSVLGQVAPDVSDWIFPAKVVTGLDALAQLGLVLFMFGVGQELAQARQTRVERGFALVTCASFLVPFAAGTATALWLWEEHSGSTQNPLAFALFLGCSLSVTAFPVLARVLTDLGLLKTRTGRLSLYAAAVGDGVCWVVLTAALALASGEGAGGQWWKLLLFVATAVVLLGPVRIWLARLLDGSTKHSPVITSTLCIAGVAASAGVTALLGIHQLIGAFLFGLAWPHISGKGDDAVALSSVTTLAGLLLPFFFLGFGLSLDLGDLSLDADGALLLAGLLTLATLTKVIGAGVAGYLTGLSRARSLELGILMNTRGLTELVVLGIGHEAEVIDTQLFVVLVVVTLVTTAMTGPGLRLIWALRSDPRV